MYQTKVHDSNEGVMVGKESNVAKHLNQVLTDSYPGQIDLA